MRATFLILVAFMALMAGCLGPAWQDVAEHFTDTATTAAETTATSTSTDTTPTTTAGPGVQTVTGPPDETTTGPGETTSSSSTTSSPEEHEPPMVMLKVDPPHLTEAGQALLLLDADADVVKVRLSMNGEPLGELMPADFPHLVLEAFSAKDNTVKDHVFEVEVEDEEGLTASSIAKLSVQLPASGAERCLFEDKTANQSMISSVVYTEAAMVAAGWRDTGAGPRATLWKLDPDHCEVVLPGWPKSIANWTGNPDFAALGSLASAVAVDEKGNIAVGGNLVVGGKPQRYTALLTESGGRLWERTGLVGEAVSSVVITANAVVISGGWVLTSDNPPRTDAVFWTHPSEESVIKMTLKAPFKADEPPDLFNERSEWIRAMLIEPKTSFLVVVGEREYVDDENKHFTRAFIARYVPLGGPVGSPSTSPGDAYKHDAVYSIAVCGEELIAGGWTRAHDDPNATPQPLFRWASGGIWSKRVSETMFATELRGAACDREGKVVGAGIRSAGGSDARVFAFADPLGPRTWYETGAAGNDAASGVVCDTRGFCAWSGYRTYNGKPVAVVRVHHP